MKFIKITDATEKWFLPMLPEDMREKLRERSEVFAIGAIEEKTACGVLVFKTGEPAEILWLAVADEFRRRGIARGMVDYLCSFARRTDTPIVCYFSAPDKRDGLYLFFASLETFTVAEEQGFVCRVPISRLPERLVGAAKTEPQRFFDLPMTERRGFVRRLNERNLLYLNELDLSGGDCVKPLCLVQKKNGEITAAVFVEAAGEEALRLSFVYSAPGEQLRLMGLMRELGRVLRDSGSTGELIVEAVTPESAALIEKLLPERRVTERYFSAVWDME